MDNKNACLLRLVFEQALYDEITDALLSYTGKQLEFIGMNVQGHIKPLQSISEQVSGFKKISLIEVTTEMHEAKNIHQHIKKALPMANFQTQLLPFELLDE